MNRGVDDIQKTLDTLQKLVEDKLAFAALPEETRVALMKAAGQLSRPHKKEHDDRNKEIRKALKKEKSTRERAIRSEVGIRKARQTPVFIAPMQITHQEAKAPEEELSPRNCYVCKVEFSRLHHFYDSMCTPCGDLNYQKRFQRTSLEGQVAIITGARLKIGYHAALLMLRSGARVIVTTRFPVDAAIRFSQESDFKTWQNRLEVYGLDLRHTPSVEIFCRYMERHLDRLDILINNAAQTVRRPAGFYAHLMENELRPYSSLPEDVQAILGGHEICKQQLNLLCASPDETNQNLPVSWHAAGPGIGLRASAQLSQIPYSFDSSLQSAEVFPEGKLDADLQQVDLRTTNSWRLTLAEVQTAEMIEVQLVNSIAPFVLCSKLAPIMRRDNTGQKHMVNVTAMEGKFYRFKKTSRHPHTNMAKAALNMLSHSASADLAKDGIYMNAVDTGWVTDEDPAQLSKHKQEVHDFQPPLDIVDGAARICDPFFHGIISGKHWCGKFLKDYFPIDW